MRWFQNRVAVALVGVIVMGGIGALIGIATLAHPAFSLTASQTTANNDATATLVPATITATPVSRATVPPGRQVDLHGVVTATFGTMNQFTFRTSSQSVLTAVISPQTSFIGDVKTFGALQPGYRVEVKGTQNAQGLIDATLVNTTLGDN